jgi:hypothetical protein
MTRIVVRIDMHTVVQDAVRRALREWRRREAHDDSEETLAILVADQIGRVIHWDEGDE